LFKLPFLFLFSQFYFDSFTFIFLKVVSFYYYARYYTSEERLRFKVDLSRNKIYYQMIVNLETI